MIHLNLLNVGMVEETGDILLILRAPTLERLLVIETGLLEGQAIALEAAGVRADRPLTQDLLMDVITRLGARVQEVRIEKFEDEAFLARLVLSRREAGQSVEIDARPSDAIALAMRAGAPILAADEIMAEMGIPEERDGRFRALFEDHEEEAAKRIVH